MGYVIFRQDYWFPSIPSLPGIINDHSLRKMMISFFAIYQNVKLSKIDLQCIGII